MIIAFEGIDGTGKTTQAKLLKLHLEQGGLKVLYMKSPGSDAVGEAIRKLTLDSKSDIATSTELLLYLADGAQQMFELKNKMTQYDVIILDRWMDSNIAYQGLGQGWDEKLLRKIWSEIIGVDEIEKNIDIVFVFMCDITSALERSFKKQAGRMDGKDEVKFELMGVDFFKKVNEYYKNVSKQRKYIEIDASKQISEIHNEIVSQFWKKKHNLSVKGFNPYDNEID